METSAINGEGVDAVFTRTAEEINRILDIGKFQKSINDSSGIDYTG